MQSIFRFFSIILVTLVAFNANSGVIVNGTRIIFKEAESDTSVRLTNTGSETILMQIWVDDGQENSSPQNAKSPFVVLPPIFTMASGAGKTIRLVAQEDILELPKNQESVFWFNALEVPTIKSEHKQQNILQIGFKTRLKIFYRPTSLTDKAAYEAPTKMTWSAISESGNHKLVLDNPTPFFISFSEFIYSDGTDNFVSVNGGMVSPFSKLTLPMVAEAEKSKSVGNSVLSIYRINDYGSREQFTSSSGQALKKAD